MALLFGCTVVDPDVRLADDDVKCPKGTGLPLIGHLHGDEIPHIHSIKVILFLLKRDY